MPATSKSTNVPTSKGATGDVVLLPATPDVWDQEPQSAGQCVRACVRACVRVCVREADMLGLSTRRRVRDFVAQPCSPPREQQRAPHRGSEYRASTPCGDGPALVGLQGPDGATSSTRHGRASVRKGFRAQGVHKGTHGELKSGTQSVLKVVKGAPPWYARHSTVLREAHTRRHTCVAQTRTRECTHTQMNTHTHARTPNAHTGLRACTPRRAHAHPRRHAHEDSHTHTHKHTHTHTCKRTQTQMRTLSSRETCNSVQ